MKHELQVFNNHSFGDIRILYEDGKLLFCGSDIAKALGYDQPHKAIERHCRYGTKHTVPHPQSLLNEKTIEMLFIPEGDVYRLIANSKLPSSEQFEKWLFDEVLPSIRKTGSYSTVPTTYKEALQHLLIQVEENEKLQLANSEMKPKAQYFDCLVDRNLLLNFRDTAKDLHLGQKELIKFMVTNKYLYRDASGALKPYMNYVDNGLFELKEFVSKSNHAGNQTLITPKGRETFRMLLKMSC